MSNAISLNALLKKTEHYDKDERYMATSDLCALLQRHASSNTSSNSSSSNSSSGHHNSSNTAHIHHHSSNNILLDTSTERRICTSILNLLDDSSNDVQAIAVKTLGVLLTTVQEEQAVEIGDRLCSLVLDKTKSELRDVYAIGLRTLVKTIPLKMGDVVCHRLVPRLLEGLKDETEDIVLACLDVFTDVLTRFGGTCFSVKREHERILNASLGLCFSTGGGAGAVCLGDSTRLQSGELVKKRSGNLIGCLAVVLSDALLGRLVETLLSQIELNSGDFYQITRNLIRTMCTISGTVGHRLGSQIPRIVPIFLKFCDPREAICADDEDHECEDVSMEDLDSYDNNENGGDIDDEEKKHVLKNELRESCFAGFKSFVLRCPVEVDPLLPQIIQAALAYMRYDPNYSYGEDDEEDEDENLKDAENNSIDDEEEEDEFSDDDDYSDDDDDSWKVRRGAVRVLIAVVEIMKSEPSQLWTDQYSFGRNKTKTVASALVYRFKEREENCRIDIMNCFTNLLSNTVQVESSSSDMHSLFLPAIVKACQSQLANKKNGERTMSSALTLISTLAIAPGGIGSASQIHSVFTHVSMLLIDTTGSKSLKLDALSFIRVMLSHNQHTAIEVQPSLVSILPQICSCVKEDWYKVVSEALRVLSEVPRFVLDNPAPIATALFDAICPRLSAHDLDQEIKECALEAAASLLIHLHKHLTQPQNHTVLNLILERLKNETTRQAALKTLLGITNSTKDLDLSPILNQTIEELSTLLRQSNRSLQQSALETLDSLLRNDAFNIIESYSDVLKEVGGVLSDTDLHMSHLGLQTTISVLKKTNSLSSLSCSDAVKMYILPQALAICPLLQDVALDSLLEFFGILVAQDVLSFDELYTQIQNRISFLQKQSFVNLAKCTAEIAAHTTSDRVSTYIATLIATLQGNDSTAPTQLFSLLTSGELGRKIDLSANGGAVLLDIYFHILQNSQSEEMKHAASYALGRAASGSLTLFLPAILGELEKPEKKKQYLLLSALKELIGCLEMASADSRKTIPPEVKEILPKLVKHCGDKEEGVRTMVAECLGSLTYLDPAVLPLLANLIASSNDTEESVLICSTVAHAVKFAIASSTKDRGTGDAQLATLEGYMPKFLILLKMEDLSVKNAALLMVYAAVHHKPALVAGLMNNLILPSLYELAQLNLKRVVDLGPFKHTVDDALPIRKSCLSIFSTSLENCSTSIDIRSFMPILAKALDDVEDVQLQAHQIVSYMCVHFSRDILESVETFVDPIEKTVNKKKGQKTGTELERANEWIKSGLRVMLALSQVEGVMSCRKFVDFLQRTKTSSKFQSMLEALANEK